MSGRTAAARDLLRRQPELREQAFAVARAGRLLEPGPSVRALARLRAGSLDRRLAAGACPDAGALLAARAAQLTTPATRSELADCLDRLVDRAHERPSRARVRPSAAAVDACRAGLAETGGRLRGPEPVYARGVAMLRVLLIDGSGPVYVDRRGDALARALAAVATALRA